jgi:hypothetical protein
VLVFYFEGCSASSAPSPTITIRGGIYGITLLNEAVDSLGDSALVIATSTSGQRYEQKPTRSGFWTFESLPAEDYSIYAVRPRFGRSAAKTITHAFLRPEDTTFLHLAEQPTVAPRLDSITSSSITGYQIYASMQAQGYAQLAILIRDAGAADSSFTVWGDNNDITLDTVSGQYRALSASDSQLVGKEVAAVAYNRFGRTYDLQRYQYRYCSQGPLSNIITLK